MTDNEIKELADRLENYNEWRRGSNTLSQPHPYQLGLDLDAAIALMREVADDTPE